MSTPSQLIVADYTSRLGWTFSQTSTSLASGDILVHWVYKSPRLNQNAMVPDHFTEDDLLRVESEAYAKQQHSGAIAIAFGRASHDLIKQLAVLYRMISAGKADVTIPDEVTLKELTVVLAAGGRAL